MIPTEERIEEAAVRVFSREGFHRTRMQTIADEARVAVGTIYNHFPSKDDLLLSILEKEYGESLRFLEDLHHSRLPIQEQVRRILERHFATLRERRELAQVMLLERFNRASRLRDRLIDLQRGIVDRIAAILETGISEGWIRHCHPRVVAQALFDLVQTLSACRLVCAPEEADDILGHASEEVSRLIWQGLRPEGTAGAAE
jgi:AcrR family transcriptional regulator